MKTAPASYISRRTYSQRRDFCESTRGPTSVLKFHVDDACADRRLQRGVVLLGLIGIREREPAHRLVEIIPLAKIAADHPGIAGL